MTALTVDPIDAVQIGVRTLLLARTSLTALIGANNVWDEPPEDWSRHYVHIGEATSIPSGTHGGQGRQVVETIHSWAKSRSARSVNAIGAEIVAALDLQESALDAVTSVTVWMVRHEFAQVLRDPDREIRHRIDRFRIWTTQEV